WPTYSYIHYSDLHPYIHPFPTRRSSDLVKITHGKVRSFVFESEILIEATRAGYRSLAVPIEALYRPGARPSYFLPVRDVARITRSEEHTSELQSRGHLVCRLLLEKKN